MAEQVARQGWKQPYSMARNYISDLGAVHCSGPVTGIAASFAPVAGPVCSPWHAVMNGSFLLQGVLIFCGAIAILRSGPHSRWQQCALLLIACSSPGVFLVGLAPEDGSAGLHAIAAAEHFLCGNAGMALFGAALMLHARPYQDTRHRWLALFSLLAGSIGLAALGLFSQHVFLGLGVGGMERVVAYPLPLWLTITGVVLLRRPRSVSLA